MIAFFNGLQLVLAVLLIIAVTLQTTKSEGLAGAIGGAKEVVFKGRKGMEEIVDRITTGLAIAFLVCSVVVMLLHA